MTHLSTWNINSGQKKGRESNCQFDFRWQFDLRPLKVKNRPDLLAFKWLFTNCWKDLDEGYNFTLDLIKSKVCTKNYGLPKSQESQFRKFWDSQVGSPRTKWDLGVRPVVRHREYYKGEGSDFFKSKSSWVLCVCVCVWFVRAPRVFQLRTNQLVVWFVRVHVNN